MIGVDFSGAAQAGNAIWVADGLRTPKGISIGTVVPARDLPGGGRERAPAHTALVDYLASATDAVAGLDFPFSLPEALLRDARWVDFAMGFAAAYPDPDAFRDACRTRTGGKEWKRLCDVEARVPFSAYNIRLYRQTWHGIAGILAPLIAEDRGRVIPVQQPTDGKTVLAETCPASLLKAEDLYPSYKGRSLDHRAAREHILDTLIARDLLAAPSASIRDVLLDNAGGDALDAVIAAICAGRAAELLNESPRTDTEALEARIYF